MTSAGGNPPRPRAARPRRGGAQAGRRQAERDARPANWPGGAGAVGVGGCRPRKGSGPFYYCQEFVIPLK